MIDRLTTMYEEIIRLSDNVQHSAGENEESFESLRTQLSHVRLAIDNIAWLAYIDMKKLPGIWEKKVNVGRQIGDCLGSKNWMIRGRHLHLHRECEDVEIEADPDLTRMIWDMMLFFVMSLGVSNIIIFALKNMIQGSGFL